MDPTLTLEESAQALLKALFRRCRDTRSHHQDLSDLARHVPMDYATARQVVSALEQKGYVETTTFGQKVGFTEAGLVMAQRLIR